MPARSILIIPRDRVCRPGLVTRPAASASRLDDPALPRRLPALPRRPHGLV